LALGRFYHRMADLPTGTLSLLIVDDDARILELTEFAARESGQFGPVHSAENWRAALAHIFAAERQPDVILTDLSMPFMDGFEFVQALKQLDATRHIPVVMFSSSGLIYDQQHAIEAGCTAYFPKPSTLAGLSEVVMHVARIATHAEIT
jgi:CheY-like chemotaxis protein